MGRSEESSRRKPTADLGGSPSGLQEGDRITRSVLEFGRCATDSGEPLVCIVTSSLKNVASPRSVDAPTAPYGKSRAYNAGFHCLSPSGVCLQPNWENSGNYDWIFPICSSGGALQRTLKMSAFYVGCTALTT